MADGTTHPPPPVQHDAAPVAAAAGGACPRPLVERQLEALGELVGIGLKIARGIERAVDGEGDRAPSLADLNAAAMAYARVSRAVRQTVMLQSRLQEAPEAGRAPAERAGALKARLNRILRRAIQDTHGERETIERLCAEAAERLERESFDEAFGRPVVEIVADICRALGLKPNWERLADDINAADAFAAGEAGESAEEPAKKTTGPIDVFWIGEDGYPAPASEICRPHTGRRRESVEDTS
jgi:hypothetical protein